MKRLAMDLATGELKQLIFTLERAISLEDDPIIKLQLKNVYRKVVKNVKEI